MLPFPAELYFHREHTWIRREGENLFRVGIDEIFLRDVGQLTDLDLPTEGDEVSQDEVCGIVRGKALKRSLYAPISGEILEVNVDLYEDLEILVEDPYGVGWILLLDPSDPQEELENLLRGEDAQDWWEKELQMRNTPEAPPAQSDPPPSAPDRS